jgi:hypothetical protein
MATSSHSGVIQSGKKSLVEWFWGLALLAAGGVFTYVCINQSSLWIGALGAVVLLLGLSILLYTHRLVFEPQKKTWSETSGFLVPIWSKSGGFDDLDRVHIRTERGKAGDYYEVCIRPKPGRGLSPLLYDVFHSESEMRQAVARLCEALRIEAHYTAADSPDDD